MPARNRRVLQVGKTQPSAGHKVDVGVICSVRGIKGFKFVRTQKRGQSGQLTNF